MVEKKRRDLEQVGKGLGEGRGGGGGGGGEKQMTWMAEHSSYCHPCQTNQETYFKVYY